MSQMEQDHMALLGVRFRHVDLGSLVENTPLAEWYKAGAWKKSFVKATHLADVFRYLIIYEYGGIYLDSDVLLMKPIDWMRNIASKSFCVCWVVMIICRGSHSYRKQRRRHSLLQRYSHL